jgi:outer membrane receptor protein involved in Fe transport
MQRFSLILLLFLLGAEGLAEVTVRGTVTDESTGKPVVGANIEVVETPYGTATDDKGWFSLEVAVALPVTLRISHISYAATTVVVTSEDTLRITLTPAVIKGKEVEVTGVRPTYKADVASAVDLLDIQEVELQGARDLGNALRRVSSVKVNYTASGKQTVNIRGSNATDVAVYLDGIKLNDANTGVADLSMIDLNSLAEIQVIKGGTSTLFGSGAVGGVINLESRKATRNSIMVTQGNGLTYNDDLDLTLSASAVWGPIGAGGQYTGRSRAYGGRTLTTSLFQNLYADFIPAGGELNARWYHLQKTLKFPSGSVDLADGLTMASLRYRGKIFRSTGWDLFYGQRQWTITQDFFTSLNEQLLDETRTAHLSKLVTFGAFESTIQLESETQRFSGAKTFLDIDGNVTVKRNALLWRQDNGLAAVTRLVIQGEHPYIDRINFELGVRYDRVFTIRKDRFEFPNLISNGEPIVYRKPATAEGTTLTSKRIGIQITGRTPKLNYALFVNQGGNKRLPTLSDHFHFSYASLDSIGDSTLTPEYLLTTEASFNLTFVNIATNLPVNAIETEVSIFINDYVNKIAYLALEDQPPIPFNTHAADIRGIEGRLILHLFQDHLTITASSTRLNVSNTFVFPFKPEYRNVLATEVNVRGLFLNYDYLQEGKQFYFIPGVGEGVKKARHNANLNVGLRKTFLGLRWSLSYTWRNLLSRDEADLSLEESLRKGFNYFEKYREILTLKVEL